MKRRKTAQENLASTLSLVMTNMGYQERLADFARKIGVSVRELRMMLHPTPGSEVNVEALQLLADALGLEPWQFITDPDMPVHFKLRDLLVPEPKKKAKASRRVVLKIMSTPSEPEDSQ